MTETPVRSKPTPVSDSKMLDLGAARAWGGRTILVGRGGIGGGLSELVLGGTGWGMATAAGENTAGAEATLANGDHTLTPLKPTNVWAISGLAWEGTKGRLRFGKV